VVKQVALKLIVLYQKTAPVWLRQSCRFTPSCSQYMALAIEKYGLPAGIFKGLCRVLRCKVPNGGIDYP